LPSILGGFGIGSGGITGMKEKIYQLFLVEAPKAEGVVVCFHHIWKGATACVKRKCKTNNEKTMVLTPSRQMLLIL
jgi:hypothetical protein